MNDAAGTSAAAGVAAGERFIDVGAGVGTVGLAIALAQPHCTGVLFERDPDVAHLAQDNVLSNGMSQRLNVTAGDIFVAADRAELASSADLVVSNPPRLTRGVGPPTCFRMGQVRHRRRTRIGCGPASACSARKADC